MLFLRGHLVFSSLPQLPITFKELLSHILSITYFVPSELLRKSQYFSFNNEC